MKSYRVPLHSGGPALWPDYIDANALELIRRESGTPVFQAMYQAAPGGLRGQIIVRDYFRYLGDGALERAVLADSLTYMTIDPAISERTSADETAITVGNVLESGSTYMRYVWHGRISFRRQIDTIAKIAAHYRPVAIGIEAVAYQTALVQMVAEEHPELPVEPIRVERDKWSRLLALAADYEFGRVLHHPSLMNSAFEQQLTHLPGKHDDMADAAAMLTTYAGGGGAMMTRKPEGFR